MKLKNLIQEFEGNNNKLPEYKIEGNIVTFDCPTIEQFKEVVRFYESTKALKLHFGLPIGATVSLWIPED